jgi:hypothetical protein
VDEPSGGNLDLFGYRIIIYICVTQAADILTSASSPLMSALRLNEKSKMYGLAVKGVVAVLEPRLELLRARGQLALGHIQVVMGFNKVSAKAQSMTSWRYTNALASSKKHKKGRTHMKRVCKKSRSGQQKGDLRPYWPAFQ